MGGVPVTADVDRRDVDRRDGMTDAPEVAVASADGMTGLIEGSAEAAAMLLHDLVVRDRSTVSVALADACTRAVERAATAAVVAERSRHMAEVAVHEERRRLAMEMHDTVGAMLFAIGVSTRRLAEEEDIPPALRCRLAAINRQANEAVATLRRSLRALYTPAEVLALDVALRADCRAFEERTGIPARLIDLTDVPTGSEARTKALVDTAREALLNVEKHACAHSVVVTVAALAGRVTVNVVDDGVGCVGANGDGVRLGLGLAAASERLERVGGGLRLEDNDEGGLTVRAWVPE